MLAHIHSFHIKFTYIIINEGFLPNISDKGKDFVATWFTGFPLLSHPAMNWKYSIENYTKEVYLMRSTGGNPGWFIQYKSLFKWWTDDLCLWANFIQSKDTFYTKLMLQLYITISSSRGCLALVSRDGRKARSSRAKWCTRHWQQPMSTSWNYKYSCKFVQLIKTKETASN